MTLLCSRAGGSQAVLRQKITGPQIPFLLELQCILVHPIPPPSPPPTLLSFTSHFEHKLGNWDTSLLSFSGHNRTTSTTTTTTTPRHPPPDPRLSQLLIPPLIHLTMSINLLVWPYQGGTGLQGPQGSVWNEGKHIQLSRALNILGPFNSHVTRGCIPINDQNK